MPRPSRVANGLLLAGLASLAACAQPPSESPAAAVPPSHRVIVETVADWPMAPVLAERASQIAGVPVSVVNIVAPHRYLLLLTCPDPAACQRAEAKLRAEPGFARAVEPDARERLPARPSRSNSQ